MTAKTCATCAACHHGPIAGTGQTGYQCRRRPPQIVVVPKGGPVIGGNVQINVNSWWPPVVPSEDGWFCYEWIPKPGSGFIGAPDAGLMS